MNLIEFKFHSSMYIFTYHITKLCKFICIYGIKILACRVKKKHIFLQNSLLLFSSIDKMLFNLFR